MPTSNYTAFEVKFEDVDGTKTPLPLQTVNVRDVTGAADLDDLESDADGHIDAGSLAIAAASVVRFSVDLGDGRKGYAEQTTTA